MIPVENISIVQLRDTMLVILALAGVIVLIGNFIRTVKEWRKPHTDMAEWRRDVDIKLNNDNERLKSTEAGTNVLCRGMLALLSHEINGNSVDKLTKSQQEITDYLIDR